jgi:hypothetical protein
MVGHKERGRGGGHGSHGGSMRWQRGVELGRCRREVMIGGAHLLAWHGEGRRRREVRRFPMREAAIEQGTCPPLQASEPCGCGSECTPHPSSG